MATKNYGEYTLKDNDDLPFYSLAEAADITGIHPNKLSRYLKLLSVPVYKLGHMILLDDPAIDRIELAVKNREIRPGVKSKAKK